MENIPVRFEVQITGPLKPYSDTISLARVRIFYKYSNRNGTYITEEFADQLLKTLPYAPIKGIYDEDAQDFTKHGKENAEGKIYGVVPENPNIAWEAHTDDDGVTRLYACADVLLYTAIYSEASEIPGKSQSMELFKPSITGNWQIIDGQRRFVYKTGTFLGLQALGDLTEPCFEGSAFFSLYQDLKKIMYEIKGGEDNMINFKLSDSTKHDLLFKLLNPNFSEEGNWEINYGICDIYDEYALCYDYENGQFCRWYYQKDDQTNGVSINPEPQKCFIMDVSEEEYTALNLLKVVNGGSFTKVDEVYTTANNKIETLTEQLETKVVEYSNKEQELADQVTLMAAKEAELTTQNEGYIKLKEEFNTAVSEYNLNIEELNTTIEQLKEFKNEVELKNKEAVIAQFTEILDEKTIEDFKVQIDNFSAEDLKKELAVKALDKNPNLFSHEPEPQFIPTNLDDKLTGVEKILQKHKDKKNRGNE